MSNKNALPHDLKKYARSAFLKKSKAFFISFSLLLLALVFFGDYVLPTNYPEAKIAVYAIILTLPFIFTKFPFCVIDSTYYGIVEKIDIKMTREARPNPATPRTYRVYDKGLVYLTIRTHDGSLIKKKVYGGIWNIQKHINIYREGDEVFHLYGTDTVVILPKETDAHVMCPVCASVNEKENPVCRECGHTILPDLSFAGIYKAAPEKPEAPPRKEQAETDFIAPVRETRKTDEVYTPYIPPKRETREEYEETRKSAVEARKMRAAHEEKLQKQEAELYADYDAQIIEKAKDKDTKKEKRSFFDEYFSYFGVAFLITHAVTYIAIPLLGNTFLRAEVNFFSQTLLFSVILFWQFFVFGKNEFPHKRVGMKKMLLTGIPAFLLYGAVYAIYHGIGIFASSAPIPGDGIHALALILCGAGKRSVMEQPLRYDAVHGWINPSAPFPQYYPIVLMLSFLLNAVYYIFLIWFAYKFGIDERDMERRDMFDGTDKAERRRKRRSFAKCFIPFVNYYPIYSWSYEYWVNPEPDRKLKYFFRGVLAIIAGITAIEILRYLFFQVCKTEWLNGVAYYLSLHLVGCVISLVAYFDDKRHQKLMDRYKN